MTAKDAARIDMLNITWSCGLRTRRHTDARAGCKKQSACGRARDSGRPVCRACAAIFTGRVLRDLPGRLPLGTGSCPRTTLVLRDVHRPGDAEVLGRLGAEVPGYRSPAWRPLGLGCETHQRTPPARTHLTLLASRAQRARRPRRRRCSRLRRGVKTCMIPQRSRSHPMVRVRESGSKSGVGAQR